MRGQAPSNSPLSRLFVTRHTSRIYSVVVAEYIRALRGFSAILPAVEIAARHRWRHLFLAHSAAPKWRGFTPPNHPLRVGVGGRDSRGVTQCSDPLGRNDSPGSNQKVIRTHLPARLRRDGGVKPLQTTPTYRYRISDSHGRGRSTSPPPVVICHLSFVTLFFGRS